MKKLFELKQERHFALNKADAIVAAAESAGRSLTASEDSDYGMALTASRALSHQIASIEKANTLTAGPMGIIPGVEGRERSVQGRTLVGKQQPTFSADYQQDFFGYIASGGQNMGASLYEGSNISGGFTVPVVVDNQVVPLAPAELAVRRLATVLETHSDIRIPIKAGFGVAAVKPESGSTVSNFGESDMSFGQFTLSAFMLGNSQTVSFELAQDVSLLQSLVLDDLITSVQVLEESFFIAGTGVNQPQGLLGNVGAGITEEPDINGNLVTIAGTLDLMGALNAVYHPGASFLMSRTTSIILRKAQIQTNLFEPAFTRVGTQEFLHGYPVEYSASMPTAARGATPVLFGDVKAAYLVGDRGGSGISLKILDQPKALSGQIVLLGYRRTDGRVRRSEAIQAYTVAAS